jgi:hypothetical protein
MKLPQIIDDNLVLIIAMGVCAVLLVGISSTQEPCCKCKEEKIDK